MYVLFLYNALYINAYRKNCSQHFRWEVQSPVSIQVKFGDKSRRHWNTLDLKYFCKTSNLMHLSSNVTENSWRSIRQEDPTYWLLQLHRKLLHLQLSPPRKTGILTPFSPYIPIFVNLVNKIWWQFIFNFQRIRLPPPVFFSNR